MMRSRRFLVLLALVAVVGVMASVVAWGLLELIFHTERWVYTDLPNDLGFDGPPLWWSLPVLGLAGLIVALAIVHLPGRGGHVPADGLSLTPTQPNAVPGVAVAGVASVGLGAVVGPEAPLAAIAGGLGLLAIRLLRRDAPETVGQLVSVSAVLAAFAFLFGSPIIAAVILIEAAGLGGSRLPLVLIPGLFASAIGSLMWIGMGSWTGLPTSEISLQIPHLPSFARPDIADFGWTILLALAVAVGSFVIFRMAKEVVRLATWRPLLVVPACGLVVSGLAIAFSQAADKSFLDALYSGEYSLDDVVSNPAAWSLSALALLVAFKGIAYAVSLGSFRGGPVFPAMFLGAAGGMMAAQLPGFELTPAVLAGIGAGVASVLRLPLSAAVLGALFGISTGPGAGPLILVGVIVAYLASLALSARFALDGKEVIEPTRPPTSSPRPS